MKACFLKRLLPYIVAFSMLLSLSGCAGTKGGTSADAASRESGVALEVYFFEAGKADAILLTTESAAVLIDCGEKGFGQTILDYLEKKGVSRIDYLIITHFDKDHVGGAAKVINNIAVGTVLQSDCPKDSEEYEKYLKALGSAGLEAVTVSQSLDFTLDGLSFSVNPPLKSSYGKDDSNNSSLIVTVYNGANVLLFMGDAQTERLAEYLSGSAVDCDLIKIPHHGGEDSLMGKLIAATKPEYAVITCSQEEPDTTDTLDILNRAGTAVYLTSEAPVLVRCDGSTLTAEYELNT